MQRDEIMTALQLSGFTAHGLTEVGALSLMSRIDTKYLVGTADLGDLLQAMQAEYSVLEIAGSRTMRYHTDYFDTSDFALYHQHHNGRANRSKVRCRHYVDSGLRFLEHKAKDNKGRTVKNRIGLEAGQEPRALVPDFLRRFSPLFQPQVLDSVLYVAYHRVTLQSHAFGERVSIDVDLCGGRAGEAASFCMPGVAIVEVKQNQFNAGSAVQRVLRDLGARQASFSKYCVAGALLYPERLKINRFKRTLSRINPHLESTRGA
jgi:hypothetical protein